MSGFKFRIWDKTKDEWLGASDKNSVIFRNFDLCGQTLRMQQLPMDIENDEKYVIEQFSGRLDYSGKYVSVYDGDIIKTTKDGIVALIKDDNGLWRVEWSSVGFSDLWDFYEPFEVIGNIHENPELLPKTLRCFYD